MYKAAATLYLFCFICYIVFSRTPDYFDSDFIGGVVRIENGKKSVVYSVDNKYFVASIEGWGASQVTKGQNVPVIFNPSNLEEASLYSFFGYWLKLNELLFSAVGFIILLLAAIFITGKEEPYYYSEEELRKKRKYDD